MTSATAVSGVQNSNYAYPQGLTPDALMVYLSTRMQGLDEQIDEIFAAQQKADAVRSAVSKMKQALNQFDEDPKPNATMTDTKAWDNFTSAHDELAAIDPALAASIKKDLKDSAYIGKSWDSKYKTAQIEPTRDYFDTVLKDLESSSQMNMIQLQSLMSARQTAVSLSTNLISALGETTKQIAGNLGR